MYPEHRGSKEREMFRSNFIKCIDNQKASGCNMKQSERKLRDDDFHKGTSSISHQMKESDMVKIIRWQGFRGRTVVF